MEIGFALVDHEELTMDVRGRDLSAVCQNRLPSPHLKFVMQ